MRDRGKTRKQSVRKTIRQMLANIRKTKSRKTTNNTAEDERHPLVIAIITNILPKEKQSDIIAAPFVKQR